MSSERVRQLVVAGDLPAQRLGNAWAVPMDDVLLAGTRLGRVADRRAPFERGVDLSAVTSIWIGQVATIDEQRSCAAR